jgi:hypothetical protein
VAAHFGVDRRTLWLWQGQSAERRAAWAEAKRQSADVLAETAGEILDEEQLIANTVGTNTPRVNLAKARSEHRRWLASKRDPATYGDRLGIDVEVDFAAAFLDALIKHGRVVRPAEDVEVIDAELMEE